MKISVVTPSLNQGSFIAETIESVLAQNDPDFEHIVVDGLSSDNTLETLRRYPHVRWVSEKDRSQADAVNKGFKMATGDIFCTVNADDYYYPGAFAAARRRFAAGAEAVTGRQDTVMDGRVLWSCLPADPYTFKDALQYPRNPIGHPSTFYTRKAWELAGGLNPDTRYAPDVEFWLRLTQHCDIRSIDLPVAANRLHSGSIQYNEADKNSFGTLFHLARFGDQRNFLEMAEYTSERLLNPAARQAAVAFHAAHVKARWKLAALEFGDAPGIIVGGGKWTAWLWSLVAGTKPAPRIVAVADDNAAALPPFNGVPAMTFRQAAAQRPRYALLGTDSAAAALRARAAAELPGTTLVDFYDDIDLAGPYPKNN